MLNRPHPLKLPSFEQPILLVVIDAEEEFDWAAEPSRTTTSVVAMRHVNEYQNIFLRYGITPTYVVDYSVASREEGYRLLKEYSDEGCALIGAHLHSWITPPFEETLDRRHTFQGNLTWNLEYEKLRRLAETIESSFGQRPVIHKAGRYGVGPNTSMILEKLGFEVDLSVCPPVDYSDEGGPDFSASTCEPYWFGNRNRLLEVPITGAFIGFAGDYSARLYRISKKLEALRIPGVMSRAGIVDRLILSPEGFTFRDHVKLTKALLRRGVRTFTWSFHSPSILVGGTPYVRSAQDKRTFLDSFTRYFDFFFGDLGGVTCTPLELKRKLEAMK